jgi:hypothetical protein
MCVVVDWYFCGLYLRSTQRRRKDGSVVRYVQLAHNRRVGGVTRAEVLLSLGREDQLDIDGLRRLAASITRFTDGDGGGVPAEGPAAEFDVVGSRPLGDVWLQDGLCARSASIAPWPTCWAPAASAPMSSGCCSRWWPTGRWIRAPSWPGPS